MTDPRSPEVLAAVEKINRQPFPYYQIVWDDNFGGRWYVYYVTRARHGSTTHWRMAPDEILKMAEGLE